MGLIWTGNPYPMEWEEGIGISCRWAWSELVTSTLWNGKKELGFLAGGLDLNCVPLPLCMGRRNCNSWQVGWIWTGNIHPLVLEEENRMPGGFFYPLTWMTAAYFSEWLLHWDRKLIKENRWNAWSWTMQHVTLPLSLVTLSLSICLLIQQDIHNQWIP